MKITKKYQPIYNWSKYKANVFIDGEAATITAGNYLEIDCKLTKIIFDDIEYGTDNPKLPLWYLFSLWIKKWRDNVY